MECFNWTDLKVGIATWHDLNVSSLKEKRGMKIDKGRGVEVDFL